MQAKTKKMTDKLIHEKGIENYRPPEQLTIELNEARRLEKIAQEEERERLIKLVKFDMPKASKQKVEAIVFK